MEDRPFESSGAEDPLTPRTEPKGELVPPPRKPPTAVGAPEQPPKPPRPLRPGAGDLPDLERPTLRQVIERALDVLDAAGDAIARRFGLR
jgi:hypothetical protein